MSDRLTERKRETGECDFVIGVNKHNCLFVIDKETGLDISTDVNQIIEGMAATLRKMVAPVKRDLQIQTARRKVERMESDLENERIHLKYLEKAAES